MKTNVRLESESRELLGKTISVMSKDGFVCITEAVDALNHKRSLMGLGPRRIEDIIKTKSFQERMPSLIKELYGDRTCEIPRIFDNGIEINKLTDLKKYKMAYRRGYRQDQKWFINPYLFVMIALELDPEIYAKVIVWLTDGLIENRNLAGEAYIRMCKAVSSIVNDKNEFKDKIQRVAKAINFIVFNEHDDGRRNKANKSEITEIVALENVIVGLINGGFIKDFNGLINYLGEEWRKKWGNPIKRIME